jgi:protein-tyrosine phosphatase
VTHAAPGPDGNRPVHVLHVCTGNICRSPMAERIMRAELVDRFGPGVDIEVRSAGTYGGHAGGPMHEPAAVVLDELGVDASGFVTHWLREPQVEWADVVLTATAAHRSQVLALEPRGLRTTFTLRELARLAAYVAPADLPPGSPGARLLALVGVAAELRGVYPATGRTADDVDDPYGEPLSRYRQTASEIGEAVRTVVLPL